MHYNENKYWAEDSELLTDSRKIEMARDLRALELQGILEYRDGRCRLVAGVETEPTPDGPVAHFPNKEEGSN